MVQCSPTSLNKAMSTIMKATACHSYPNDQIYTSLNLYGTFCSRECKADLHQLHPTGTRTRFSLTNGPISHYTVKDVDGSISSRTEAVLKEQGGPTPYYILHLHFLLGVTHL